MSLHTQAPIRIVIADGSELLRRGIRAVLAEHESAFQIVGEAATPQSAVSECVRNRPDIVLLDIDMAGQSAAEACAEISQHCPDTRIAVLTAQPHNSLIYDALRSGAKACLRTDIAAKHLVQALQDVAAGRAILDADVTTRMLRLLHRGGTAPGSSPIALLSAQERRVLARVAEGMTNRQVGEQLGLSENTVKNYLVNAFEKLHVKRRAQAAAIFAQVAATTEHKQV